MARTHGGQRRRNGDHDRPGIRLDVDRGTRIGGIRDGQLYCTHGRGVSSWTPSAGFVSRGTLPIPGRASSNIPHRLKNGPIAKMLLRPIVGAWTTTNLWPLQDGPMLATVDRQVFRSGDGGRSWEPVHRLPPSSGPMGVLPTSVCRHDGAIYLAEYTLGDDPARILRSVDDGRTWETYVETTAVRHFHGVFEDPYSDVLWATSGDRDDECAIGRLVDGRFVRVGGGSQQWRAVGLAFTPSAVLWGMDCSYAETVELLRFPRDGSNAPTTVGRTDASTYYAESLRVDGDVWVALATAAEVGGDSTAPPGHQGSRGGDVARVLLASSSSDYEDWHELATFRRRQSLGSTVQGVPTASAYVFLAADPALGLVINPFNTRTDHGAVIRIPPERLPRLAASAPVVRASGRGHNSVRSPAAESDSADSRRSR